MKQIDDKRFNVLFLCTGNSARSILAEALVNNLVVAQGNFAATRRAAIPGTSPIPTRSICCASRK